MVEPTHVEVDLQAIADNVAALRARNPQARMLIAVKADGYGHGAVPIARRLDGSVEAFGVARVCEGVELREAGISTAILKLSPSFGAELEAAVAAGIELTVHDHDTIIQAGDAAQNHNTVAGVHLAVDTGMRRIGCEPDQVDELVRLITAHPHLELRGVFTHLPISDVPEGSEFTIDQLAGFREATSGVDPALVHAGASAGVLAHDLTGTTMVRPGIATYGLYPDPRTPKTVELRPALSWKSRIMYVKRIAAGETVSYGRTWAAPTDRWIGTVPVGYGDGYSRRLSNRGRMLVGGVSYPIAGRVCMDQTMIDLGPAVAGAPCPVQVGDEVVLIGRQDEARITADEIAELMGTINYEVTCLIADRVPRVYVG